MIKILVVLVAIIAVIAVMVKFSRRRKGEVNEITRLPFEKDRHIKL